MSNAIASTNIISLKQLNRSPVIYALIRTSLLISLVSLSSHLVAQEQSTTLYSASGHPYSDLIRTADEVKIFYSQFQGMIQCRVALSEGDYQWQSGTSEVSDQDFEQQPLKSCLPRDEAKRQLALHYQR